MTDEGTKPRFCALPSNAGLGSNLIRRAEMATLPENPTDEQIEKIFSILKMKASDRIPGVDMQQKYKRFDAMFEMKAVAYHRLVEYLKSLPPNVKLRGAALLRRPS